MEENASHLNLSWDNFGKLAYILCVCLSMPRKRTAIKATAEYKVCRDAMIAIMIISKSEILFLRRMKKEMVNTCAVVKYVGNYS